MAKQAEVGPHVGLTRHSRPVEYRAFIKASNTSANWAASLLVLAAVCFTTTVNFFYDHVFDNTVDMHFNDAYGANKEWLFGGDFTGALNESLVYDFMASNGTKSVVPLVNWFLSSPSAAVSNSSTCISLMGQDAGSFYAFCDRLDPTRLPAWATNFDAVLIQKVNIASIADFRKNRKTPVLSVLQGFQNTRLGWYEASSVERNYCTTRRLAQATRGYTTRKIYTKVHGVMTSVDCSAKSEEDNEACLLIQNEPDEVLFDDTSGYPPSLRAFEVLRTDDGTNLIMCPFTNREAIGLRTLAMATWLVDYCLYLRHGSIGWFGMGKITYTVAIPTLALLARVELIAVGFVVWRIKYRCKMYRVHHALFQASRLGLFPFFVLQIMTSAFLEQDIMRTIYSWERRGWRDWGLFIYAASSVSLTCALVALSLVRIVYGASISTFGCWSAITLPLPVFLLEIAIADRHYSAYTMENGLLTSPIDCDPGFDACAHGKTNYLCFVVLLAMLPTIGEYFHRRQLQRRCRPLHTVLPSFRADNNTELPWLTSFEIVCLDEESVSEVVRDVGVWHTWIHRTPHVTAPVVSACGFTIIKDRFLVRTKDLGLLLCAAFFPRVLLRDASLVVWPLVANIDGTIQVAPARRVLLSLVRFVHVHPSSSNTSLLQSAEHPLA